MQKGLLLIALPLLYQALFIGVLLKRQAAHNEAQRLAVHTKEVLVQVDEIYSLVQTVLANARGYVLTQQDRFADDVERLGEDVGRELKLLGQLTSDNPQQAARWREIAASSTELAEYERRLIVLVKTGRRDEAVEEVAKLRGAQMMEKLSADFGTFRATEANLDSLRMAALERSSRLQNWLLVGGLTLNVAIGAACAALFGRGISRRLAVLTENTARIARGEELVPRVSGRDEITELDANFHTMAGDLARARQQERVFHEVLERRNEELTEANRELDSKSRENEMFVYSVSHDLRSPLVNLQGFCRELGLVRGRSRAAARRASCCRGSAKRARGCSSSATSRESIHFIQTAVHAALEHHRCAAAPLARRSRGLPAGVAWTLRQ